MKSRRLNFLVPLIALLAVSSAPAKPGETPSSKKPQEVVKKPKYKKPGMNHRGVVSTISVEKLFELQQSGKALIFDARHGVFFKLGHIPGAISLPKDNCDEQIHQREPQIKAALAAGKTIVVYCSGLTCPDARAVARHIADFGYPASIFYGGWDEWKNAGMPTE